MPAETIFPELSSPRVQIFEKVNLIEKAFLDETPLRFPGYLQQALESLRFLHLRGLQAAFDDQSERLKPKVIGRSFFSALSNQGVPLLYIIWCRGGRVDLFMGSNAPGAAPLAALLEAHLGPALLDRNAEPNFARLWDYRTAVALTGIPTDPQAENPLKKPSNQAPASLDSLLSTLLADEWAYIVQAYPIARLQVSAWHEAVAREIKETKEAFQLRDIQKADRMASYYMEILEKTLTRLRMGKQQGFWQTGVYFLTGSMEVASRGAALLASLFSGEKSTPEPLRTHICVDGQGASPFLNACHSGEVLTFTALPNREFPGFRLKEEALFDVDFDAAGERAITLGLVMAEDRTLTLPCTIPVDDLTKHALVAGVTGSGKTNTVFTLLERLTNEFGIPFLVIEPAKSEYRKLLDRVPSLLIFTLGEEQPDIAVPFRLNPFAFPEGVSLQTHIDYLKAVFNASFVMYAPMPYVLEDCLYQIYEDKGWNLVTSTNHRSRHEAAFPTLDDLYHKIDRVVADLGYQDRTAMDIKAALKTRIRNLCIGGKGMMLNTCASIPFAEIMARPTVLELKYLGSDEEKAFMMGLILTALGEYYDSLYCCGQELTSGLQHLTVIEEAHRLLKNVPTEKSSEDQSNVKGKGVETFCNLVAEIRAYGEGILVSEQIPSKLAPDVVKNSNVKIMHRMVAKEDRELMGDTMNLDLRQKRHAVSLELGKAIFFREGLDRPIKVSVDPSAAKSSRRLIAGEAVRQHMLDNFFSPHQHLLMSFAACQTCVHRGRAQECEQIKAGIEDLHDRWDMEVIRVKCFLPYLLVPDRGRLQEHLKSLVGAPEAAAHCLSAQLIRDYLHGRADFLDWPFTITEEMIQQAQNAIVQNDFGRLIGTACREAAAKREHRDAICETYCREVCLTRYEMSVLTRDPRVHNRMADLLDSREYGLRFYQELAMLIVDFLRDYVPQDQSRFLPHLALCFLVHKLEEFRFSLSLQKRILNSYQKVLEGIR